MSQKENQDVFGDIAGQLKDPVNERTEKSRENLYLILNKCNIPAVKIDMDDGTERYLCNIYSNIGVINRFDITPEGILDVHYKQHSEDVSYFPINVPVTIELTFGKEKARLFLQNRIGYEN